MLEVVMAASLFVKANGEHVQVIERENNYSVMGVQMPKLESGLCPQEKEVAAWARWRLRALLSHPSLHIGPVKCPDFQPTMERHCANVYVNGESIVTILLRENLAAPYVCNKDGCPPKLHDWCAPREPLRPSVQEPPAAPKVPVIPRSETTVAQKAKKPKAPKVPAAPATPPVATARAPTPTPAPTKTAAPKQPVLVEVPQTQRYFPRTAPAALPPALLPPKRGTP
jgi:hypothetical protein